MSFIVERVRRRPGAPAPAKAPATAAKRPMSRDEIAQAVSDIKEGIRRMRPPMNHQPEAWHEDKDELVRKACLLEDAIRGERGLRPDQV
jgi:hypothetical protein